MKIDTYVYIFYYEITEDGVKRNCKREIKTTKRIKTLLEVLEVEDQLKQTLDNQTVNVTDHQFMESYNKEEHERMLKGIEEKE